MRRGGKKGRKRGERLLGREAKGGQALAREGGTKWKSYTRGDWVDEEKGEAIVKKVVKKRKKKKKEKRRRRRASREKERGRRQR